MELIKLEAGIDVVHVPYKGLGGAISDLIGGHVQVGVAALQSVAPHVQSGKLRMLAVLSAERAPAFPDVPTLKEQGLADLAIDTWYAAFAPAGTPAAVIRKLNAGINDSLNDSSTRASLEKQGMTPGGGDAARLEALLKTELARWARVVNAAGIKAD
jgi:tripartite-type tricarboxylate transporter receptor subunit TctC